MFRTSLAIALLSSASVAITPALAGQRIDRASPSPVRLAPGGLALTVELTGSALQLLSNPRVVVGGRPVQGVSVTLAPPNRADMTRRTLQLTAEAGLTDLTGLELVLVSTSDGRSLTAPLSISVAASGSTSPEPGSGRVSVPSAGPGAPTVVTASPKDVQLTPGASRSVTVWGTNLDRADVGRATYDGAPLSGVRVEFVPSANPDQREVRVTVASNASLPWNTVLGVEIGPRGGPWVSTPVELSVLVPDLAIASVEPYPNPPHESDSPLQLRLQVENRGLADAEIPAGITHWTVQGSGWQKSQATTYADLLRAGYDWVVPIDLLDTPAQSAGTHTLTLTIDPAGAIRDADDTNNVVTTTVTIEPGLYPDLAIVGATTDPSPAVTGVAYDVVVTVRNIGNARAEAGSSQSQRIRVGSNDCPLSVDTLLSGMQPNAERNLTLEITDPDSDLLDYGTHSCELWVELQRSPDEVVTTNNVFTFTWSTVP